MKTVFTNEQCAHVWAQQKQESGRTNNGNMYFEGNTIYSYGRHYPIARFVENKGREAVLFNSTDSSMTTKTKHKNAVNRALIGHDVIYVPNLSPSFERENVEYFKQAFEDSLISMARARKNADMHYNQAVRLNSQLNTYLKLFGRKPIDMLKGHDMQALQEIAKENARKQAKVRAKAKKKRIKELESDAIAWRKGESRYLSHDYPTCLRMKSLETVQTSQGAEFPLQDALKALPLIRACKSKGVEWNRNGESIKLGHFQVDRIEKSGNVKAGCHYVTFKEIQLFAESIGQ